jgi:hypothetical protein
MTLTILPEILFPQLSIVKIRLIYQIFTTKSVLKTSVVK